MTLPGNLTFHNLYKSPSSDLMPAVIRFMSKLQLQKALSDRHFVVAASTDNNEVVGVSTSRKIQVPQLNSNYVFECQVHVTRESGNELYRQVLLKSAVYLSATHKQENSIGIMIVVQDKWMTEDAVWWKAIWEGTGFALMGFTTGGNPIYLHYFKDTRI